MSDIQRAKVAIFQINPSAPTEVESTGLLILYYQADALLIDLSRALFILEKVEIRIPDVNGIQMLLSSLDIKCSGFQTPFETRTFLSSF